MKERNETYQVQSATLVFDPIQNKGVRVVHFEGTYKECMAWRPSKEVFRNVAYKCRDTRIQMKETVLDSFTGPTGTEYTLTCFPSFDRKRYHIRTSVGGTLNSSYSRSYIQGVFNTKRSDSLGLAGSH